MKFMGKKSEYLDKEDQVHTEAADTLIGGVSNADLVNRIEQANGRNIRDQASQEEVEDWDYDRRLRRMTNRN